MCVWVAQSCPTPCDPKGCSPPGSSVHGLLQARILKWVASSLSRGSSRPRDRTLTVSSDQLAGHGPCSSRPKAGLPQRAMEQNLLSILEPKHTQLSPASPRHRGPGRDGGGGGSWLPQVYDVPNWSGHVRELWPPRWCQGARLAGQPGGYLVRARSQQALSSMWKSLTAGHVSPPPPLCKTAKLTFPGYRRPMNRPGNRLFIDSEESSCPCVTMITF